MHQIINDILESTKRRIPSSSKEKKVREPRSFHKSVNSKKQHNLIPVISEVKPSSPSRFIRNVSPLEAAGISKQMESAGAAAISVLTEPEFFKGNIENLGNVRKAVNVPVLRKDFIIKKAQVYEAESDMILLIAGILGKDLCGFVDSVISSGRQPLVEVHNENELELALLTGASIIGINNRDLTTMKVDISTTERLAPVISGKIVVSESGISTPEEAVRMMDAGADAILVGTSIMEGDIYSKTYELVNAMNR